jgi:hypothetical protein
MSDHVCATCSGDYWVCENHPDRGWPSSCECGAGMPCPTCNINEPGVMPLDETGKRIVPNLLHGSCRTCYE